MFAKWRPNSLFGKLLTAHLIVILITLLAVGFFFSYLVEKYFFSAHEWELTDQAMNIGEMLAAEFQPGEYAEVIKMSWTLAHSMGVKIRVIDNQKNEIVLAVPQEKGSEPSVDLEPNEIDYVLQGDSLTKKIYGPAIQRLLVSIPIFKEDAGVDTDNPEIIGAITITAPLTSIKAIVAQISQLALYSFLFATVVAGVLAFSLSKNISRPLQAMTGAARELVQGNFRSQIKVKDTGEMGQLAATFNQAVEEVNKNVQEQKRLQALRQNLVASVSHEFRAPLTSIQGFVDAMLEGLVREEEREKYLKIILSNTLHLNRLVDDLLELASIESGYVKLRQERVSPYSLAVRALDTVLPQAREKEINLKHKYENNLPPIWGDPDRLYQVLVNLLENAHTYTPVSGKIVLESKLDHANGNVIFSVSDNGVGIPPEEIPHIWERFHKVDKARNRANKGKGLGLAIVRELVHLHGGHVKVDSTPGKGSIFSVMIPVQEAGSRKQEAGGMRGRRGR